MPLTPSRSALGHSCPETGGRPEFDPSRWHRSGQASDRNPGWNAYQAVSCGRRPGNKNVVEAPRPAAFLNAGTMVVLEQRAYFGVEDGVRGAVCDLEERPSPGNVGGQAGAGTHVASMALPA